MAHRKLGTHNLVPFYAALSAIASCLPDPLRERALTTTKTTATISTIRISGSPTIKQSPLLRQFDLVLGRLLNHAARFNSRQLRQEHLKFGSPGITTWPHCSQIDHSGRSNIGLN